MSASSHRAQGCHGLEGADIDLSLDRDVRGGRMKCSGNVTA